jgi:adenine deaminase
MTNRRWFVTGKLVDIPGRQVRPSKVHVESGRIAAIEPLMADEAALADTLLMPGLIDAHVHIESSMLVPTEFARMAVTHGTVATVSDPHEIANVLGVSGVEYMLANAAQSPMKFCFGAPSCVPATSLETAGAVITVSEVKKLLDDERIGYLAEMMNFPGILNGDRECLAKVEAALQRDKPVDGHAPGLRGKAAARYFRAGITTDHECFDREEAIDKLATGCKISIREGSAARNFDALCSLIGEYPGQTMLCSDDKHPDELALGHINLLVLRAIGQGIDRYDALRAACITPIEHYRLDVGQLRVGDPADFIEVGSFDQFDVRRTWIDGELVAENGISNIPRIEPQIVNQFDSTHITPDDLAVPAQAGELQVIEAIDGQLITGRIAVNPRIEEGRITSDPDNDILKLTVVSRYRNRSKDRPAAATPAIAFIKNFGLRRGAIASSVAHDSHNVIAVGTNDDDLAAAINAVMDAEGGLSAICHAEGERLVLPLPVAGLMATGTCQEVGHAYQALDLAVKSWGSSLRAPYMTLSFMALLVIPELKLSDRGLFDCSTFDFTPLVKQ